MDADHPVLHLMYHRVTNGPSAHPYTVTASRFEEHLRVAASAEQDPTRFFRPVFTFDDGHSSNYGQASSLLTKYGHAGLFFVTAGWIETRPDFMCWSEVKQLYANGHAVGCHGLTHKLLTCCSEAELYRELTVSKELLERKVGTSVDAISMPGGRWDVRVLSACARAGYRRVFTSDPGTRIEVRQGLQVIPRVNSSLYDRPEELRRLLTVNSSALSRLRVKQGVKKSIRRVLGDRLYHRLWCVVLGWRDHREAAADLIRSE